MEEEKIDRILKLVDMLEVTDENRDDIAKVKKLIEQKKYAEMLEVLKKVTSKNETKIKEDNRTILFRNEEKEENKEENKEEKEPIEEETAVLKETKEWLNLYFSGKEPKVLPKMHLIGTKFQNKVWQLLLKIPYGKTMTYKDIARMISPSMSAQAVGSAVGHNKISILIPCHRVIGSNNNLTGYAGGIERKEYLLKFEKKNEI